jgi:hypothetical protein
MHDEGAVGSRMDVEFHTVAAPLAVQRGCETEACERVLWRVRRHTAVSDDEESADCGKAWGRHVDPMCTEWENT